MSRKYLPVNREKPMFLPLDMQSWVSKDHFVWFLVDVAGQLDTSALEAGTSPGRGRPGYDPQMLATLVMYAMSCGVRRMRVHRGRKGERRSMSEADYAGLIAAAHHQLQAPLIIRQRGCRGSGRPSPGSAQPVMVAAAAPTWRAADRVRPGQLKVVRRVTLMKGPLDARK